MEDCCAGAGLEMSQSLELIWQLGFSSWVSQHWSKVTTSGVDYCAEVVGILYSSVVVDILIVNEPKTNSGRQYHFLYRRDILSGTFMW